MRAGNASLRTQRDLLLSGCLLLLMPLGLGVVVAAVAEDGFVARRIFVFGTLRIQIRLSGDSLKLSRILQVLLLQLVVERLLLQLGLN